MSLKLENQKFGKLSVIKRVQCLAKKKQSVWECVCSCGKTINVSGAKLISGSTKSCGCLKLRTGESHPRYSGYKEISGRMWANYKKNALERQIPFEIPIESAWELFEKQNGKCSVSNISIHFAKNQKEETTASLDRIDSSKGYVEGNVQWVHKFVNLMKLDFDESLFKALCLSVSAPSSGQKRVLVTGSQGFIGSFVCEELLNNGYTVFGIDDYSKYGKLSRNHDNHPNFKLFQLNILEQPKLLKEIAKIIDPTDIIHLAAKIGGISYFHKFAFDLIRDNSIIDSIIIDIATDLFTKHSLRKITALSSSMVYENTSSFPTKEGDLTKCPPPSSTYGFSKLATEFKVKGAWEQYNLPYTIIRPFNCIGVGEEQSINESEITSGNVKLMLSHVVPDLVNKVIKGQDPLHILGDGSQTRCYTNGRDIARGIRVSLENPHSLMEDFNISTSQATTVLELSKLIWTKLNPGKPFKFVSDEPFDYDVQKRIPDTSKAKNFLGFEAKITLEESLDEVIAYFKKKDEESCGANNSYTNQS